MNYGDIEIKDMENSYFLIGLLNAMMNNLQTVGDTFFEEMSWKQCFVTICIRLFKEPPSLKELSEVMNSSHQNVRKMVERLEKNGFVKVEADKKDKRKQRLVLTERAEVFTDRYRKPSDEFMNFIFSGISKEDLEITIRTLMQVNMRLNQYKDGYNKEVIL